MTRWPGAGAAPIIRNEYHPEPNPIKLMSGLAALVARRLSPPPPLVPEDEYVSATYHHPDKVGVSPDSVERHHGKDEGDAFLKWINERRVRGEVEVVLLDNGIAGAEVEDYLTWRETAARRRRR